MQTIIKRPDKQSNLTMKNKNVTVVIPTLQKCKDILHKLIEALDRDESVMEILLIDNSLKGFNHESKKLEVITPKENLFVNPSWNLGVKKAKSEIVALLNDDIIIPEGFCKDISDKMTENMGLIGFTGKNIEPLPKEYKLPEKGEINLEPINYLDFYYGVAMFFFKKSYVEIPEEMKIVYGDNYIFNEYKKNKFKNYRINGCKIYHYGSLSSGAKSLNPICRNDAKIYKKLTVKWFHRILSFEEVWDCYKLRFLGLTFKISKNNPLGK